MLPLRLLFPSSLMFFGLMMLYCNAKGMWRPDNARRRNHQSIGQESTAPDNSEASIIAESVKEEGDDLLKLYEALRGKKSSSKKTFQDLQAEAEATLYTDNFLRNINRQTRPNLEGIVGSSVHDDSGSGSYSRKKKKQKQSLLSGDHVQGSKEEDTVNEGLGLQEIESFLISVVNKLEDALNSPDFVLNTERFLADFLNLLFKEKQESYNVDNVKKLFGEFDLTKSIVLFREYLTEIRRTAVPSAARFIRAELSPSELRALLALDLGALGSLSLPPDVADIAKRLLGKLNTAESSDYLKEDFASFLSSMQSFNDSKGRGAAAEIAALAEELATTLSATLQPGGGTAFPKKSEEALTPEYASNFMRSQMREFPLLAELAGVSAEVVNDDKKWAEFAETLHSEFESARKMSETGRGGKGLPAQDPHLQDVSGAERDSSEAFSQRSRPSQYKTSSGVRKAQARKQSFQSIAQAL